MREIKFRGKAITGIWVYGGMVVKNYGTYIINEDFPYDDECKVIPETAGQYAGLHDKNGKEIYEGDILFNGFGRICEIIWFQPQACFDAKPLTSAGTSFAFIPNNWHCCEVIGNIYENPELLEVSNG
jgi:hypothetical protein